MLILGNFQRNGEQHGRAKFCAFSRRASIVICGIVEAAD